MRAWPIHGPPPGPPVGRVGPNGLPASSIDHPHVVSISDFGETAEHDVFFTMDLLAGRDLQELLEADGKLPWPRTREILLQVTSALHAAHLQGQRVHDPRAARQRAAAVTPRQGAVDSRGGRRDRAEGHGQGARRPLCLDGGARARAAAGGHRGACRGAWSQEHVDRRAAAGAARRGRGESRANAAAAGARGAGRTPADHGGVGPNRGASRGRAL